MGYFSLEGISEEDYRELTETIAPAFTERLVDILNSGSIALMTSIGHRTGLFDAMAGLPPSTSEQIADVANLNERYVREWLDAIVVGRIVEHDPEDSTYHLPQEHAAFLTRAASPDNIAAFAQYIPLLGSVEDGIEDGIVESLEHGGGCPTRPSPASTRLWPKTAARRFCRP